MWISTDQIADLGSKVTLECTATGRPTPRVVWKRNGGIVLENYATAKITMSSISRADRGIYECSAINIVANDTKIIVVNVEGWKIVIYYIILLRKNNIFTLRCGDYVFSKVFANIWKIAKT